MGELWLEEHKETPVNEPCSLLKLLQRIGKNLQNKMRRSERIWRKDWKAGRGFGRKDSRNSGFCDEQRAKNAASSHSSITSSNAVMGRKNRGLTLVSMTSLSFLRSSIASSHFSSRISAASLPHIADNDASLLGSLDNIL